MLTIVLKHLEKLTLSRIRFWPAALSKMHFSGDRHIDEGRAFGLSFTDVIMSGGMNGRQLVDAVRTGRPVVRVLFMSGYTEDAISHHGRLDPGVLLPPKPYWKSELARMIRIAQGS